MPEVIDVQTDMFHGHQRSGPAKRNTYPYLKRNLLIRGPLRASAQAIERLQDFGGRRARIAGSQLDSGFERRQRNRLIPAQ